MIKKTISEINEKYELEIPKIIKNIKNKKAKKILLQFPEGLKPYSQVICDEIESKMDNKIECMIWLGDCYGGCDIPNVDDLGIDMIVQFGHSEWNFKDKKIK